MKAWQLRHRKPCWCLTAASGNDHLLSSFKQQNCPCTISKPECGSWGVGVSAGPCDGSFSSWPLAWGCTLFSPRPWPHRAVPALLLHFRKDLRSQAQSLVPALSQPAGADLTTSWMSKTSQTKLEGREMSAAVEWARHPHQFL